MKRLGFTPILAGLAALLLLGACEQTRNLLPSVSG